MGIHCDVYKYVNLGRRSFKIFVQKAHHLQRSWYSSLITSYAEPVVVYVDLGLERKFQDINKLNRNIEIRGLDYNIYNLYNSYKELKELQKIKVRLEKEKEYVVSKITQLHCKEHGGKLEEVNSMKQTGRNIRLQLKKINSNCTSLEHKIMNEALKLPVALHHSVNEEMLIVKAQGQLKNMPCKLRNSIGIDEANQFVKSSLSVKNIFYLKGKLAKMLYDLEQQLEIQMQSFNILPFSCPSIVMSVIYEGCGQHLTDKKAIVLQQKLESENRHHLEHMYLTGVSPTGFIAFLTRMSISESSLPLRLYSIGSKYFNSSSTPNEINLHHSSQRTILEVFGCAKSESEMEDIYYEYINAMESIYNSFNLPVRMIQTRASELEVMEAARTEMQVWFPSKKNYYKVGWISMWGDYVSRRLMITPSNGTGENNTQFLFTVHGTIVDMTILIAAMIENSKD